MDLDAIYKLVGIIFAICGIGGYILRSVFQRIDKIEQKQEEFVTNSEIRELIHDKIDPVREDIKEMRVKLDQLYEFLLTRRSAE